MTKESRHLWNNLQKARKLELEKRNLMNEVFDVLDNYNELDINLHASNSSNLGETLSCFVDYGEDEDKLLVFFEMR